MEEEEEEEEEELCNLWVKQAQSRCNSNLAEIFWTSKPRVAYFLKRYRHNPHNPTDPKTLNTHPKPIHDWLVFHATKNKSAISGSRSQKPQTLRRVSPIRGVG